MGNVLNDIGDALELALQAIDGTGSWESGADFSTTGAVREDQVLDPPTLPFACYWWESAQTGNTAGVTPLTKRDVDATWWVLAWGQSATEVSQTRAKLIRNLYSDITEAIESYGTPDGCLGMNAVNEVLVHAQGVEGDSSETDDIPCVLVRVDIRYRRTVGGNI